MDRVLDSAAFINGPEIAELEAALCTYCGAKHCIAVASGTDALMLALMAMDFQAGDEVCTSPFSFFATAAMPAFLNGRINYVDIDPITFNIDHTLLPKVPEPSGKRRVKAIIPVSLYGQCANMDAINAYAKKYNLRVLEDAAQSFGAAYRGRQSCNLSDMAITSFFPAKPLGCYGDGGAVFTNCDELAEKVRLYRNHGQSERYRHSAVGLNSRMDTMQAAILLVKLAHYPRELEMRSAAARRYDELLAGLVETPKVLDGNTSSWAQYTVRIPKSYNRDQIRHKLEASGIPAAVHYPLPIYRQQALACDIERYAAENPNTEEACQTVLSLPMHAFITAEEQMLVAQGLRAALGA